MAKPKSHEHFHRDGSLWARGQMLDGDMHGYWEFFRKDGVIMRSGHFDKGVQVGEWTTYDKAGKVHKVTQMKAAARAGIRPARADPRSVRSRGV